MPRRLAGRVVLVTGATGIAAAAARRFASEGATTCVVSIDEAECATLAAGIEGAGGRCTWLAADLREEAATVAAVAAIHRDHGRLDGLLAVAGGSGRRHGDGPLHEVPLAGWDATVAMNLTPAYLATREALRTMLSQERATAGERGAVVLISSAVATHPSPRYFGTHAYATAKGAIDALTRAAAAYYAPQGIRVNAIAPGTVATPMAARAQADAGTAAYVAAKQPLAGGFLPPEAVADAALFLLSDEARYVTGQVLAVDGGWSVTEVDRTRPVV